MLKDKTIVYFHIATIGNYQEIVDEIFKSLHKTDLINVADKINLCVVGNGDVVYKNNWNIEFHNNIDVSIGEFYTLKLIEDYSNQTTTNDNILYIHTKGVTTPDNKCINDWRKYMLHFNVEKHFDAIKYLAQYDTYGVDFTEEPTKHYSGNFWWANTDYIKKLPPIDEISNPKAKAILTIRHNAEFWIGMSNGNHKSMHNSNINVYERHLHSYPESLYL